MKFQILLLLVASVLSNCEHMRLGDLGHGEIVHHTVSQYPGISNLRRLKYIVYTNLELKKITGIEAYDHLESQATANVIAGGIGFTFVTIRLKSEKSKGLNYEIKIYSS